MKFKGFFYKYTTFIKILCIVLLLLTNYLYIHIMNEFTKSIDNRMDLTKET